MKHTRPFTFVLGFVLSCFNPACSESSSPSTEQFSQTPDAAASQHDGGSEPTPSAGGSDAGTPHPTVTQAPPNDASTPGSSAPSASQDPPAEPSASAPSEPVADGGGVFPGDGGSQSPSASSASPPTTSLPAPSSSLPGDGLEPARDQYFLPTSERDNTGAPQLRAGADGSLHAVYPSGLGQNAYYGYCWGNCTNPDKFTLIPLNTAEPVTHAQVALDRAGRPRVLLGTQNQVYFAACEVDCTNPEMWSIGVLLQHDGAADVSGETLAIDPDGGAHFTVHTRVTEDPAEQGTPITFYGTCIENCTDSESWEYSQLADAIWEGGSLRFAEDGTARLLAGQVNFREDGSHYISSAYLECASECDAGGWSGVVFDNGLFEGAIAGNAAGPSLNLELTAAGAPRWVALLKAPDAEDVLLVHYACDEECSDPEAWSAGLVTYSPNMGAGIGFDLDAAERPRVAYSLGDEIQLAYCDAADCTAEDATWGTSWVELASKMGSDAKNPWPNCSVSSWALQAPSLQLLTQGQPHVAYRALDVSGSSSGCLVGDERSWARITAMRDYH